MTSMFPLPSITKAAAQSRPDPSAGMMALLASPGLVTLSGPPEVASLVAIYLSVRASSAGCQTTYSDLRPNETVGRALWAAGQVNALKESGPHLVINRDPIVLNHPDAPRRVATILRNDKPRLWVVDNLQSALADPAEWTLLKTNPGITPLKLDPDQAALTLLQTADELGSAILVLTATEATGVDAAADIRLTAARVGKIITLSAISVATGATPGPIQFEMAKHAGVIALRLIHSETSI